MNMNSTIPQHDSESVGTVFICYSRRDGKCLDRLLTHLTPVQSELKYEIWSDKRIRAGTRGWDKVIANAIDSARVVILIVSADFFASEFIMLLELPRILTNADENGAMVLPLIWSASRYRRHPELVSFQSVNDPLSPLNSLDEADQEIIYDQVAELIEEVVLSDLDDRDLSNDVDEIMILLEDFFSVYNAWWFTIDRLIAYAKKQPRFIPLSRVTTALLESAISSLLKRKVLRRQDSMNGTTEYRFRKRKL